jgi:hypothetical protein
MRLERTANDRIAITQYAEALDGVEAGHFDPADDRIRCIARSGIPVVVTRKTTKLP